MCGIFCSINNRLSDTNLETIAASLDHRGPDGRGFYKSPCGTVSLVHTRLSINDLFNGKQPIFNESREIVVVCNGEIYEMAMHRKSLEEKGHKFSSNSDSEIVLHLYEEYEEKAFTMLRGEFSFILYDIQKNFIYAARDRFGVKPLYVYRDGDSWCFGSEAKSIFAAGVTAPKIDPAAVRSLLAGVVGDCIFQGISSIPPGHFIRIDLNEGTDTLTEYWKLPCLSQRTEGDAITASQAALLVREAVIKSVNSRLQSDVPIGLYLSGGLDSSIIASILARTRSSTQDIRAYTITFPDGKGFDETSIAKATAEFFGINLNTVECDQETLISNLEESLWHAEVPLSNLHSVAKFILAKRAREDVKVVLTGEGADETFLGYSYFREGNSGIASQMDNKLTKKRARKRQRNSRVEREIGYAPIVEHNRLLETRYLNQLNKLFADNDYQKAKYEDPLVRLKEFMPRHENEGSTRLKRTQQFSFLGPLRHYLLVALGDRAEMGASLEGRPPFLDHSLVELAATIPDHLKISSDEDKIVLRHAFRDYLPEWVVQREKWPFTAPSTLVTSRKSLSMRRLARKYLSRDQLNASEIFDAREILGIKRLVRYIPFDCALRRDLNQLLMVVLSVQIIHKQFTDAYTSPQLNNNQHKESLA